jgi:3-oxoacyl-[acyl-carrier-protein] synthase-3
MKKALNSEESMLNIIRPCRIRSTGIYLPRAVESKEIEKKYGLPIGWSEKHSGVANRHHVSYEDVGEMGALAAQLALKNAGLSLNDIDTFITAGASTDQIIPSQAAMTLEKMSGGNQAHCESFHVNTTCLSFINAFKLAADKLQFDETKYILIVASEVASFGIGPENWETLTLFGDGAAAVILEKSKEKKSGLVNFKHQMYTEGIKAAEIPGGHVRKWVKDYIYDPKIHHFQMDSRSLLRLTLKHLPDFINEFFKSSGTSWPEVNWTVPHQASKTGLNMIPKIANVNPDKVINILRETGNCISASIPMGIHKLISQNKLKRGETLFICGTSAGFSLGSFLYIHD